MRMEGGMGDVPNEKGRPKAQKDKKKASIGGYCWVDR